MNKQIRKLYRNTNDKVIAGVCSGIGDYLRLDPVLVRLLMIAFAFAGGAGLAVYIVAWVIVPASPQTSDKS